LKKLLDPGLRFGDVGRIAAVMAKASMTRATWRCQPRQERVSLWSRPSSFLAVSKLSSMALGLDQSVDAGPGRTPCGEEGQVAIGDVVADQQAAGPQARAGFVVFGGVVLSEDQIVVYLTSRAVAAAGYPAGETPDGDLLEVRLGFMMRRRQGAMILEAKDGEAAAPARIDRPLVRALVLAKTRSRQLESGEAPSIRALSEREGLCNHYAARLLPLAYLAPDITDRILASRQHRGVSLAALR
jgi:hypothetical protein